MQVAGEPSFDRIARAYRWLEYLSFGRALERCRSLQLGAMDREGQALLLGDGDGRFTASLLARETSLRVVAVDSSAAMLALLSRRVRQVGASSRLVVVEGDAVALLQAAEQEQAPGLSPGCLPGNNLLAGPTRPARGAAMPALDPAGGFLYVCSHFFLDCLSTEEVERLVEGVVPRLAPGALWIVSEFAAPCWWTRLVVALLYRGFALLTGLRAQRLPDWRAALSRHGFACVDDQRLLGGLLTSTLWHKPE